MEHTEKSHWNFNSVSFSSVSKIFLFGSGLSRLGNWVIIRLDELNHLQIYTVTY